MATAIMNQAEPRAVVETFWRNIYLRGQLIYDQAGEIAGRAYDQPETGVPFGRSFVIGGDQVVELPLFGYDPDLIIRTIDSLLRPGP